MLDGKVGRDVDAPRGAKSMANEWTRRRGGTIGTLVARLAAVRPQQEALVDPTRGVRLTFEALAAQTELFARAFLALGVQRGDRVAVWAENVPEWIVLELALARIGAILVTANTALKEPEIEFLLAQSGSCAVVFTAGPPGRSYADSLAAVRGRLPALRHAIFIGDAPPAFALRWSELPARAASVAPPTLQALEAQLNEDDVINMQYTSGTTGFPKGVMLTHRNLLHNAWGIGQKLHFAPGERLALTVPLFHCFGCVVGTLGAYVSAVTICLLDRFDAASALDLVVRERCNLLYGVPTHFRLLVEEQQQRPRNLATLRSGIMGGAPCPEELVRRIADTLHLPQAVAAYGLTECSPGVTINDPDDPIDRRATTVGKAMPDLELRIVDPVSGETLPHGAIGELWVRGPCTMRGYWKNPEATAQVLRADGWLSTGDLATLAADGYLRIVGRLKEMVIRGGENVYPAEVEAALRLHPGVRDVAVFGLPDPLFGEQVHAAILPAHDAAPSEEELRRFLTPRLAGVKVPSRFHLVDAFPLTASGKVQKWRLVQQFTPDER